MRLIDSETVKEYLKRAIFGADTKIDKWVDVMPTIDAIPVEWLEDRELDYRTTGDKLMSDAFAVVIDDWQKEQEGR